VTDFAVIRQRTRKPGKLARRLGFTVRAALWTAGGLLAAAYLLAFVSPMPPPNQDGGGRRDSGRDGRLVVDLDGRTAGPAQPSIDELTHRLQEEAAPVSDLNAQPGATDGLVYSEDR
jgi:hypothetical protein